MIQQRRNEQTKQAFIDIRLRPGIATLFTAVAEVAPITAKRDVIHKPGVHNVAQRRRRRTEPRAQWIRALNFVPIGPAVPKIC